MTLPTIFAVIPVRDRQEMTIDCLASLDIPLSNVVVVDNMSNPPAQKWLPEEVVVVEANLDPPNISLLWNYGLDEVSRLAGMSTPHAVAILNNDIEFTSEHPLQDLRDAMMLNDFAGVFPDISQTLRYGELDILNEVGPVDLSRRMTGFCFMIQQQPTRRIRADIDLAWFYGDDDVDNRLRAISGCARVGGVHLIHKEPSVSTNVSPELTKQAGIDRETFLKKWGFTPW